MRRVAQLTTLSTVIVLAALACSEEAPLSTRGVGQDLPPPQPRARPNTSIYDEDGVPRESDTVVAGLTLPLGLEEIVGLQRERRHVYSSEVPPQKLLRYFGPRLNTLSIDHEGERVVYREAIAQRASEAQVRLDVSIEPTPGAAARVEVFERPPMPPEGTVVSEEEIRAHLDTLRPERRE